MKLDVKFGISKSRDYTIFIDELEKIELKSKVAIITNETVAKLHLEKFRQCVKAKHVSEIIVKDGEQYKNLKTIEYILDELFKIKFDRKSTLIAFGGGVIGDMTGFAASIYERGVDFIQVPTTLLSQVDASVGGKTGVNNRFGKNLVGSFHQPRSVYCESKFLTTLPPREFNAGVAEIIKMAAIFDRDFFEWLQDADLTKERDLQKAILQSIKIKAKVVSEDEKEEGIRAALNYGHTFAHVIENETNYTKYLHGEAVAIGICMANALAVEIGLLSAQESEKIEKLLKHFSLPTNYKIENADKFYEAFFLDKKSGNNKITFILPFHIGNFQIKNDISEKDVKKALRIFG